MHKKRGLSGLERLLAIAGHEVTTKSIRTGTHLESCMERVLNFSGCNSETAGIKGGYNNNTHQQITRKTRVTEKYKKLKTIKTKHKVQM